MPTEINPAASSPTERRRWAVYRPAFWVVFPLLLGLLSLALSSRLLLYRDVGAVEVMQTLVSP